MTIKKINYISGLPRTGTTLLSSILNQNPLFHSGPNSQVLNMMNCLDLVKNSEMYIADQNPKRIHTIYNSIIYNYHMNENPPICFDKNRGWTGYVNKIKQYINPNPKIICMTRDIKEILASFIMILRDNDYKEGNFIDRNIEKEKLNDDERCKYLLGPGVLGISIVNLINAVENHIENILLIDYKNLTENPKETMKKIYTFLGEEDFEHNFNNIEQKFIEDDLKAFGIKNLHTVRPKLNTQNYIPSEILSEEIISICENHPILQKFNSICRKDL
jgi:sulfotransferase